MIWHQIETAPRDGSRFLFSNGKGFIGIGFFMSANCFACDSWRSESYTVPTHWMKLPELPT